MSDASKKDVSLRLEFLDKMSALATGGLGLVAALAWNDAIQAFFLRVFGTASGVIAKFVYAVTITAVVVILTVYMSRAAGKLRGTQETEK